MTAPAPAPTPARRTAAREADDRARARLRRLAAFVAAVAAAGAVGYMLIEGWNLFDAVYMTVITLATVGYMEVHPLSTAGRAMTMVLILVGFGTMLVFFVAVTEYIVSGALAGTLRRRRMEREIESLSGHMIVCGYGRVGQQVVADLTAKGERVVVVEERELPLARLDARQLLVEGDATDDEVLRRAGIARARGLVAVTGDDAVNIVLTLTARTMNPDVVIVARADQPASEPKLRRAGATRVISLYQIAGNRIAAQLRNPRVTDFLDDLLHSADLELWLEDVPVAPGSQLDGRTVEESHLREASGVNLLAVSRQGSGHVTNPPGSLRLQAGDDLIVLGTAEQLGVVASLAGSVAKERVQGL